MSSSLGYSFIDQKKSLENIKNKLDFKPKRNATIKKRTSKSFRNNMKKILNKKNDEDEEDEDLDDFKPLNNNPEKTEENEDDDNEVSMQSFKQIASENPDVKNYMEAFTAMGGHAINDNTVSAVDETNNIQPNNVNDITNGYVNSYIPYYTKLNNSKDLNGNEDVLMKKLNYMINLLEEQQDQRTENVTEELVLYSFLGIFVIFVVDAFARAGKYTR